MSTTIDIAHNSNGIRTPPSHIKQNKHFLSIDKRYEHHMKKLTHSFKVGFALVLVSLLYILDPLFEQVGEDAMWAIMTIEVIFEFFAGATLSKGLLRAFGTIIGGGLGCLASFLANNLGKNGSTVVVGVLIFIFGTMATYCRSVPSINKRYDYGVMIFILTFNLVAASSLHADKVMELAHKRLSAVGMGFLVCIFVSLLIFPMWATDELNHLTASKFNELACCIEECIEAYFSKDGQKESQPIIHIRTCKSVLHSKSSDELLMNFARWEPGHGSFGFCNSVERKCEQISELLRELASLILSLHGCLSSPFQPSTTLQEAIKEPCNNVGVSIGAAMRELGESIMKKKPSESKIKIVPQLQSMKLKLMLLSTSKLQVIENVEHLAFANLLFLLVEMVDKVELLAKEVEAFGRVAGFQSK